jgi:sugar lactone lactonase YvrE
VGEVATPGHIGAAVLRRGGGLVLCLPDGPVLAAPSPAAPGEEKAPSEGEQFRFTPLGSYAEADVAAGQPAAPAGALRSNDAKADPAGRMWLGTMAYDETPGASALYRLDSGAAGPVRVLGGVTISNGLGWSSDAKTMYYIDTPTGWIDAFDYDLETGELANRRGFAQIPAGAGSPDGMTTDADGGVWVALWGGGAVRRYRQDGSLDRVVEVGTPNVTSCAFAGADLDLLVITTATANEPDAGPRAGLTYAHRPGDVVGTPVDRYAG